MKKKEYQKPTFYVVKVKQRRMICNSDPEPGTGQAPRYDYSEN